MDLAIICASAPALRAFFGRFLKDHFTNRSKSRTVATEDSIPLKTATMSQTTLKSKRPDSAGTTVTAWPGLGTILVTEDFHAQSVLKDTEAGQAVWEEIQKSQRALRF